uniref:Uncharacterized protein n=2 Tax=Rhizobium leguminosarum TaxID=384 RepID=A0A0U3IH92_RHILV|nr:hypothetical protein [Rhizobium leguminosarum bv. viciae]KZA98951.1 hypothetical protein A4A59_24935 [Rhizobium leguminosarum]
MNFIQTINFTNIIESIRKTDVDKFERGKYESRSAGWPGLVSIAHSDSSIYTATPLCDVAGQPMLKRAWMNSRKLVVM